MAQSRAEPTIPSASTLNQLLDEQLDKVEKAFATAFKATEYDGIFSDYWSMISPTKFPCDDLAVINRYYNDQPKRIPIILEARRLQDIPLDKKLILKALSDLCHSFARIKYIVDKLTKMLPKPELVAAACREVHARMNGDIIFDTCNHHDIHREVTAIENHFYHAGRHLILLGYQKEEALYGQPRKDGAALSLRLQAELNKLKNNDALNALIEPIEAAKKAGRDITPHSKPLADEIAAMREVQRELAAQNEAAIQRLDNALPRIDTNKQRLGSILSGVDENAFIFQFCSIISELQDERSCPSLAASMKAIMGFCDKSCSRLSTSTLGMISDPWREAKFVIGNLSDFNNKLISFFDSYTGTDINIFHLSQQYTQLKQQHQSLCTVSAELHQKIEGATQADQRYQQAISNTAAILQDHLHPVKSDSMFAFIGRHWDKMAAGGAIGGTAAVAVVLLSTNPILLTACIASGIAMGAAGGTGGGLIQDVVIEKKQNKKLSAPAAERSAQSYGSFWRTKPLDAAAAEPAATLSSSAMAQKK